MSPDNVLGTGNPGRTWHCVLIIGRDLFILPMSMATFLVPSGQLTEPALPTCPPDRGRCVLSPPGPDYGSDPAGQEEKEGHDGYKGLHLSCSFIPPMEGK